MSRPTSLILTAFIAVLTILSISQSSAQSLAVTATLSDHNGYNISCYDGADGSIDLTVTGGVPPYSYSWNSADGSLSLAGQESSDDITGLVVGTYEVVVTDSLEDTETLSIILTGPTDFATSGSMSEYAPGQYYSCATCNDGVGTLQVSGAVAPYSFVWDQSVSFTATDTSMTGTNFAAESFYSYTITDANGCTLSEDMNTPPYSPPATLEIIGTMSSYSGGHQVSIYGGSNGWIDLQVVGGTPPYSYSWSNSAITPDISNLSVGTYTVTVTDASSTQAERSFTLNGPANPLAVELNVQNPNCFGVSSGQLTTSVSGATPPYTYMWRTIDGSPHINGTTGASINQLTPGTYSVRVKDANNDSLIVSDTIVSPVEIQSSIVPSVDEQGYHLLCAEGSSVVLDLSVSGGTAPYTYQWDNGKFTQDITVTEAGNYMVQVKDALNCIRYDSLLVNAPEEVEIDAQWHIYPNGKLFSCDTCNDAQVTLSFTGGVPPYDFTIFSASQTFTGPIFTGIYADTLYTLHFEDAIGCVMEMSGEEGLVIPRGGFNSLGVSAQLSQYPGGYNISTNGGSDGWIDLNIYGEMSQTTIAWSDGTTGDYRNGLSAGTYEAIISDNAGQSITQSWTLSQPSNPLTASLNIQELTCFNDNDGQLEVVAAGGVPPYQYLWSTLDGTASVDGAIVATIGSLSHGTYSVKVTDVANDTIELGYHLFEAVEIVTSIIPSFDDQGYQLRCFYGDTTTLDLEVFGGTPPYSYQWDNGKFSQDINVSHPGTFYASITDSKGCQALDSIVVNSPPLFIMSSTDWHIYPNGSVFSCDTCNDGQVVFGIQGGVPPYQLAMESAEETLIGPAFSGIDADVPYELIMEDAIGCRVDGEPVTVSRVSQLNVTAELSSYPGGYNISSNGGSNGSIKLNMSGLIGVPNIVWSDTVFANWYQGIYRYNLTAGTYQVTVTDPMGSVTKSFTLTQPSNGLSVIIMDNSNQCDAQATLEAVVGGGVPPYTYSWLAPSAPNDTLAHIFTTTEQGHYEVVVTDANGSTVSTFTDVSFNQIQLSLSSPLVMGNYNVGCLDGDGTLDGQILGGQSPYSIVVDNYNGYYESLGSIDSIFSQTDLQSGYYNIQVTDNRGCQKSMGITLMAPQRPNFVDAVWHIYPNGKLFSCDTCNDAQLTVILDPPLDSLEISYFLTLNSSSSSIQGPVFNGIHADTSYNLLIEDEFGCSFSPPQSQNLVVPRGGFSTLQVLVEKSTYPGGYNVSSYGGNDGYVNIEIVGLMSSPNISWSDGWADHNRYGMQAGTYELTVSDNAGQSVTKTITMTQPSNELTASVTNSNGPCNSNANLNVYVNGGTPPYLYQWYDQNGFVGDGWSYYNTNVEGEYSVLVLDANNDSAQAFISFYSHEFSAEAVPVTIGDGVHVTCNQEDGAIVFTVFEGTGPFEYRLTERPSGPMPLDTTIISSDSTVIIGGLKAAQYTAYISEVNGPTCGMKEPVTLVVSGIDVEMNPHVYPNTQFFSCDTCNDGILTIDTIRGGTPPYQVLWSTGETSNVLTGMYADTLYNITITDANGCTVTDGGSLPRGDVSVIFNMEVSATLSQYPGGYNVGCFGCNNGSIELHITGGIPPYVVVWNTLDSSTVINNLAAGTYSVHVSDQNGNVKERTYLLSQPQNGPSVMLSGSFSSCNWTGQLRAMVNGGTPPYAYYWSDVNSTNFNPGWEEYEIHEPGNYGLWLVDANSDSVFAELEVFVAEELMVSADSPILSGNANASCTGNDGSIILQLNGGILPYRVEVEGHLNFDAQQGGEPEPYQGYFSVNTNELVIDSLKAGNYHINVSDASNCAHAYADIELKATPPFKLEVVAQEFPSGAYFSCDTCADGTVTLQPNGGEAPINYMWLDVPEEFIRVGVKGASLSFDDVGMIVNTDAMEGMPPVAFMGQTRNGLSPDEFYTVIAVDQQGCMGMKVFSLEGPRRIAIDTIAGPVGPTGPQGEQGPQGEVGPVGANGAAGADGSDGAMGSIGPTGAQGPQGDIGAQGPTGAQGIAGADGSDGATGPIGPTGAQGLEGEVGPQGPTGAQGIAGANGADGATGPIGLTGAQGPQGDIGPQGPTGAQGIAGADGTDGVTGPIGLTGAQGPQGDIGPQGLPGPQGIQGDVGPQGPAGQDGVEPAPAWRLGGNSGNNNWLGTDDNTDVLIKSNNQLQLRVGADGVTEVMEQFKLSGVEDVDDLLADQVELLIVTPDGSVARWGNEHPIAYFPIQPQPCRSLSNGNTIPYWDNGVGKIFTVCEPVKVGIGTDNPLTKLDVRGQTYSQSISVNTYDTPAKLTVKGGGTQSAFEVRKSDDTPVLRTLASGKTIVGAYPFQSGSEAAIYIGDEANYVRAVHGGGLRLGTSGGVDALIIEGGTGDIGIGTLNPSAPLHIKNNGEGNTLKIDVSEDYRFAIEVFENGTQNFLVQGNGYIWGRELNVKVGTFPDYVFQKDYELPTLAQVEAYVNKNSHLPEIPSAAEVQQNGMNVGEMNTLLLKKVEELTLYLIEQDKQLQNLQKQLNELKD